MFPLLLAQGYIMKIKCALWKGLGNHCSSEGTIPKKKEMKMNSYDCFCIKNKWEHTSITSPNKLYAIFWTLRLNYYACHSLFKAFELFIYLLFYSQVTSF